MILRFTLNLSYYLLILAATLPLAGQSTGNRDTAQAKAEAERAAADAKRAAADGARSEAEQTKAMAAAEKRMAEAEKEMEAAARKMAEAERQLGRRVRKQRKIERRIIRLEGRPRLGVIVKTESDAQNDKVGALVEAVTPGSPAAEAGLKAGDLITAVNGQKLADGGANKSKDDDDDNEDSVPAERLIELIGELDEGKTVKIDYRRGTENRSATATLRAVEPREKEFVWFDDEEMPGMDMDFDFDQDGDDDGEKKVIIRRQRGADGLMPPVPAVPPVPPVAPRHPGMMMLDLPERVMDLDLIGLNPGLGEYFGTQKGVLVVESGGGSALPLKAGDVILKIGGREPSGPAQAMRMLNGYDAGETVEFEILRQKKKMNLTAKAPARDALPRQRKKIVVRED